MKNILIVLAFILTTINANGQTELKNDMAPKGTVSVQPMINEFNLNAGESQEVKITVNNKSERNMKFNVYLGDWRRDSSGAHVYSKPGTESHSCTRWITFDKKFLEVDTNQSQIITLKIQIPDSPEAVEEMKWSMLFIEAVEEAKAPAPTKLMKSEIIPLTRFGVHIYQTPPSITEKEMKLLSFTPIAGQKGTFRILTKNTGKVQLYCKSYMELSSVTDINKKYTVPSTQAPLFPDQVKYFDFQLPASIPKGKYTLVGVVDPGSDLDVEAAQMTISVD